ncbi:MAG: ATP-dependent DNA helicase [Gammaproteobacteria bacterium]|nr:ATP-dependent DNA helicase [Gammaproteobacteria bacterium]
MGLNDALSTVVKSPFDYRQAVRAHLPHGLPEPGDDAHTQALIATVEPLIRENPGRTFFLFTSYRALKTAAELLRDLPNPVFVQGTMSRTRLVSAFMDSPGAVLLATQSFWEGVDVRGSELRCLIIDKLPFPNPSEPLFQAQAREVDEAGGNSFAELSLPKTVLSLKQGFGRLIREETDRGLFVIGDSRLQTRSYKDYILGNLPEMDWLDKPSDAIEWLREL